MRKCGYLCLAAWTLGLCLLLYPVLAEGWNSFRQMDAIKAYAEAVAQMDGDTQETLQNAAAEYNHMLAEGSASAAYGTILNIDGNGMMGYLSIPVIGVTLPICHGVEEESLQRGVGHLPWSSLPVGGRSSHCVLSGHRGLPSAQLLTDLDRLKEGDRFYLHVLDRTLTYEVDSICVVEPQETATLGIREGEDLCTLVTCTPYGINSHRLLVRGHRVGEEN